MGKNSVLIIIFCIIFVQISNADNIKEIVFLDYDSELNEKVLSDNAYNMRKFFFQNDITITFKSNKSDTIQTAKYILKNGDEKIVIDTLLTDVGLKQVCVNFFSIEDFSNINLQIDSLSVDEEISFYYGGNEDFIAMRSCRMTWIEVIFNSFYFNPVDSTLHIAGFTYNDNDWSGTRFPNVQILVGNFKIAQNTVIDSSDTFPLAATIEIRKNFFIDSLSNFNVRFKVTSTDYLCFVSSISDSVKLSGESVYSARSKIYKISNLLKQ